MKLTIEQIEEAIYFINHHLAKFEEEISDGQPADTRYALFKTIRISLERSLAAERTRRVFVSDVPSERTALSFSRRISFQPSFMNEPSSDDLIQRIEARLENLEALLKNLKHSQSGYALKTSEIETQNNLSTQAGSEQMVTADEARDILNEISHIPDTEWFSHSDGKDVKQIRVYIVRKLLKERAGV